MSVEQDPLELAHTGPCVRIAQITDTHLEERAGGTLLGMDTDNSLRHVLHLLRGAGQPPDLILATGDLASNGSEAAYRRLRACFDALGIGWYWLPGNHDDTRLMSAALSDGAPMRRCLRIGGWQILLLDSTVPGEVGGRLGERQLRELDALLAERPDMPALVCLHHQPVPIGCAWLDQQKVADGDAFLDVLARRPQVRGVIWGHVHQEFSCRRGEALLLAAPSTCIQFAPHSEDFALDDTAPGMRWLELMPDGRIRTSVERVSGIDFSFDRDSGGYL